MARRVLTVPLVVYTLVWLAGSVAVFWVPDRAADVIWTLIGLISVAAIVVGVRRNRPERTWPWLLIAAGVFLSIAGEAVYDLFTYAGEVGGPYPSVADVFYLGMYPPLVAGMLGLSRSVARTRVPLLPVDAMVVLGGLGLLSWVFLISPHLFDPGLSLLQRVLIVAYPVGDLLVLAIVARLVIVHGFSPAVVLLCVGAVGLLVADTAYGTEQLHGHGQAGWPARVAWLLCYGGWAAAALHPSMAELTRPARVVSAEVCIGRQVSLLAACLLPQALLVFEAARGRVPQASAIGVAAGITALLFAIRLFGLLADHRRHTDRTEIVRAASARLASARDVPAVRAALQDAVERLAAGNTPHTVQVIINDGGHHDVFTPRDPPDVRIAASGAPPTHIGPPTGPATSALVCPLRLDEHGPADADLGMVILRSSGRQFDVLQAPMQTLASAAAQALERLTLTAEITRRDSEQYFRALVQNAADVILIVEPASWRVRYASPSAARLFGPVKTLGRPLLDLVAPECRDTARDQLTSAKADTPPPSDWVMAGDGARVQVEAVCQDLSREPAVAGIVVTLRDVTEQRRLQRRLTYLAYHDSLTGLANRVAFRSQLQQATEQAGRSGMLAAVLFVDLDDFKIVNDTLGHETGDRLLREVAKRLSAGLGPHDTPARLGGDEFAVLVQRAPDVSSIETVAQHLVAALERPFTLDGRPLSGRASVGVSCTADAANAADLLRQADLALYAAKAEGKGRWCRYDASLGAHAVQRMRLRSELERAAADGQLFLEYQPIVRLADAVAVGFEALVRWHHPTRGRLGPAEFIDIAEESDTILAIGTWVLREAVGTAATWQANAQAAPYVSVNVSVRQFHAEGFADAVQRTLADAALPADRLMLEITESLLLADDEQVWQDLGELRRAGVRMAIDDFGTGYSALNYLRHMPLDVLKLDRVFTSTIATSSQQADFVAGIIKLAETMRLEVIAEGIEQPAERDLLRAAGCRYGQGYLYSRPLTAEHARRWQTR
ncbi:EAL domain-containing protein [Catellatospora citrea]|uniref:putative bifunctional diguanylate cyclase/phosphodiesterase n=1 Tax=Catellatospora citrea TaxID=53366 RepID=UPI0033C4BC7C